MSVQVKSNLRKVKHIWLTKIPFYETYDSAPILYWKNSNETYESALILLFCKNSGETYDLQELKDETYDFALILICKIYDGTYDCALILYT